MNNPKKSQTLHVESLNDELSVYDWQRLQMHSLNPTAAKVFELCDGETSPAQMAKRLEAPEAVVWQSLDELHNAHLLNETPEKPAQYQGMTRQQFLKVGGAVALASIVSIVVPRPAAAQSPVAGAGGGGGAVCGGPITRTGDTLGGVSNAVSIYIPLSAEISDAELAACNPTQMTIAWSGADNPDGDIIFRLANANGGPYANATYTIPNGSASPVTVVDTNVWTGARPYNGFTLDNRGNPTDWVAGIITITLT